MRLYPGNIILIGMLVVGAIIMLYLMIYASQALIEEINPAAFVTESWLQGIARTLK